ncbi:unnamed protein product [Polarella glacialis]|uniref:ABC1 atypical kinase-like domain-containing protein n=2 Tax=Polarella glacialis TaxID=89957 RepID=A0A813KXW3_POLGL|nr:unnamed protein product [Polarella glacialis]
MGSFDVPGLAFPEFGTVSQRTVLRDVSLRRLFYFHRSTNLVEVEIPDQKVADLAQDLFQQPTPTPTLTPTAAAEGLELRQMLVELGPCYIKVGQAQPLGLPKHCLGLLPEAAINSKQLRRALASQLNPQGQRPESSKVMSTVCQHPTVFSETLPAAKLRLCGCIELVSVSDVDIFMQKRSFAKASAKQRQHVNGSEHTGDNVPPFPDDEAMAIMRADLGQDLVPGVFSELGRRPVAAASLGQVYRGRLRSTGEEVAVKVQRPGLEDTLSIDMFIFRKLSQLANSWAQANLGCNITLVVDEFGAKLWEESNYLIEAAHAKDFARNFAGDPTVKIMKVFSQHTSRRVITMEWIEGVKSTDLQGLRRANIDVDEFIRNGVQASLRQLLEFGLFHGDPHAGNIFAMKDGRIAYVDFGNVATISEKQRDVLVRAITHVSNNDYEEIANDFVRLGFLRPGTDVSELVPAMEEIWSDSMGKSIRDFNFRTVTGAFSKLVYQFPIRIPERFSLVIRALLMQEGICLCLNDGFSIIEVALPYASKRLLSDPDPSMRRELMSIVFRAAPGDARPVLQWDRLKNLVALAKQARDGTSIQFNQVIVEFFRGLRRDFLMDGASGLQLSEVVRGSLEALVAGDRLRVQDVMEVVQLVSPDLTTELARQVADALIRDSVDDVLRERGVQGLKSEDLTNPWRLGKVLSRPDQLLKLLPRPGRYGQFQ